MADGEVKAEQDLGYHNDVTYVGNKCVLVVLVYIFAVERIVNDTHTCD